MPLEVGLGVDAVDGSMIMLVPITREVALSVAVADCETTGAGLLVVVAMVGMEMVAESLLLGIAEADGVTDGVGASLTVVLIEVGGVRLMLLKIADALDEGGCSEAGTERDPLGEGVGAGDTEEPMEPVGPALPDGRIPELREGTTLRVSDGVGRTPEEGARDGNSPEDTAPVGTTPEDGRMPEGSASDGSREGRLLGGAIETGAVGPTDGGTSETAEERKPGRSEMTEDTTGGRIPDGTADGAGVGAVPPRRPLEGRMPGNSDTIEDRTGGRSSRPELAGPVSEVGIAPELNAGAVGVGTSPVPNAVVMPMTMPEAGSERMGCGSDTAGALVGSTTGMETSPVPTAPVGVT